MMAMRDYICCKSCGWKLVYDGYYSIRDSLDAEYGTVDLICPSCLDALEVKLAKLEQSTAVEPAQVVGKVVTVGGYPDDSQHTVEWLVKHKDLKDGDRLYLKPPAKQETVDAVPVDWSIKLFDRADGCKGHYAIGRRHKNGYMEYWNPRGNCWAAFSDDVLTLDQAQQLLKSMSPVQLPAHIFDSKLSPYGEFVREMRVKRELYLKDMADFIGINSAQMCDYEFGRKELTKEILHKTFEFFAQTPAVEPAQAVPYGWHITGLSCLMVGEYAERDAKAAAKRCGGTTKAIPLYTAQPAIDDETRKRVLELCNYLHLTNLVSPLPFYSRIKSTVEDLKEKLEAG